MRKWRPWRATKLELLQFIKDRQIIFIYSLVEYFGYTYKSAQYRLNLLRRQGLATSDGKGAWVLTEEGIRRLRWLKARSKKQSQKRKPEV